MALSNCLECGKKVSTSAKICPSCGFKDPTKVPDSWTKIFTKSALVLIGIPTITFFLATWIPYGETGFKDKTINKKISIEEKQKKNISGIDYNKMLDFVSNRLQLASQSTPSIGEFQLLSCMMNNMKPEYLSGTFLLDGMYDGGPRKDMYYKMKKIFDDMDDDILKMSVDCSSNINQFAR